MKKSFITAVIFLGILTISVAASACDGGFLSCLEDIYWFHNDKAPQAEEDGVLASPAPAPEKPAWIKNAIPFTPRAGRPLIALVIDDMGVDRKRSVRALKLPPEVTMSYLPYARDVKGQVAAAKAAGHEILVHVPMEPMRRTADPGPDYLGVKFPEDELRRRILKNLSAFDGYVGINNHMGSKFTQDRKGLETVMRELKQRDLMFLDSVTIGHSVAEKTARENGLPTTHRDVFLDDEETNTFTEDALHHVESIARRTGAAVAIGHPRDITLKDLQEWLPTLEAKGFQLAPLTAVVQFRLEKQEKKNMVQSEPVYEDKVIY